MKKLLEKEKNIIQEVFNQFLEYGSWPESELLNIQLRDYGDLWENANHIGLNIISAEQNRENAKTRLTVLGISQCDNSAVILSFYVGFIKYCVKFYLANYSKPKFYFAEFRSISALPDITLMQLIELVKGEARFINSHNNEIFPDKFEFNLTKDILKYEKINNIYDYLKIAYPWENISLIDGKIMLNSETHAQLPVDVTLISASQLAFLRINQYKVLRPLDGEGYSIEYLKPALYPDGIGCVISRTLANIQVYNLSGKSEKLDSFEKIILSVRAHNNIEFQNLAKKLGATTGEFLITTENYKNLIEDTEDLKVIKEKILFLLFHCINYDSQMYVSGLSICCSLNYKIERIWNAILLLENIGDIQAQDSHLETIYSTKIRLNPAIYKEIEGRYKENSEPPKKLVPKNAQPISYDFFICHASEDKIPFVESLAFALREVSFRVWYDNYSLKWGDKLRRTIESGLSTSRFGIVILSMNFFAKEWPQKELDALFSLEGSSIRILPVWLNISADEVHKYIPLLADRLAIKAEDGIPKIVEKAIELIKPENLDVKKSYLSENEVNILIKAGQNDGQIHRFSTDQSPDIIKIGSWSVYQNDDKRLMIEYLETLNLLEQKGIVLRHSQGLYELTSLGYKKYDEIMKNKSNL